MRNREARLSELDVAVQEEIEVDRAGSEARTSTCSTEGLLDVEQGGEERAGRERRVEEQLHR